MKAIDTLKKQIYLEKVLSPLRSEAKGTLHYAGRVFTVYLNRCLYCLYHLFHNKVKWCNDQYIAYQVAKSPENPFTTALEAQLKKRKVEVLTLNFLMRKINSCPLTQQLYNDAEEAFKNIGHQQLTISLIPRRRAYEELFSRACCLIYTGQILMRADLSANQALSSCIFELFNAKASFEFSKIYLNRRHVTAEKYAIQNERIEYENSKKHTQLLTRLVNQYGWDPSLNIYLNVWNSFAEYLRDQKLSGHFDYYVKYHRADQVQNQDFPNKLKQLLQDHKALLKQLESQGGKEEEINLLKDLIQMTEEEGQCNSEQIVSNP